VSFAPLAIRSGLVHEGPGYRVIAVSDAGEAGWDGFAFGMVADGVVTVERGGDAFRLRAGMYFALADGRMRAEGGTALAIVVRWSGLDVVGGPVEAAGRLRYIDGCTDTLIVAPPRRGDPCLNHLHIPAGTDQTAHTHDRDRVGIIVRGRGTCRSEGREHALAGGMGWVIPAGTRHAFATDEQSLDVIAWHPDSDTGPTDADHPMINRTHVPA
jgi:quercetin dioxygenase-like cupin family protein